MLRYRLLPCGDCAAAVDFSSLHEEEANAAVHSLYTALMRSNWEGIQDAVPAVNSLMIVYDPEVLSFFQLKCRLLGLICGLRTTKRANGRVLRIPCLYDGEDLEDMEKLTGLTADEIIRLHSAGEYHVLMLGFLPGFVYLGGLDERIHAPRLSSPRKEIPAGSVGIGGSQTGVYPMSSPGGWRLIGRTPIRFYTPENDPPVLCRAGDTLYFVPVDRDTFDEILSGRTTWNVFDTREKPE